MVSSLDGFIAAKDGDISWMDSQDTYNEGIELSESEISAFLNSIDCYVMGSNTFMKTKEFGWPYGSTPAYVVTHRDLKTDRESVRFLSGNLIQIVNKKLKPNYKNIWVVGGSILAKEFLRLNLVNEIVLTIMPVILGDGILFFDYIKVQRNLHLKDVKAFNDGMVELHYEIRLQ